MSKSVDFRDLPEERLSTADERGRRLFLYPAEVRGFWKNLKNRVHGILILIFLILPWFEVNGTQSVLLDLPGRRFTFFGLTFWAHDAPKLVFLLAALGLGIGVITAIWGRVWCGWACPQTVFIDGVFRRVETWISGPSHRRRALAEGPWTAEKVWKTGATWFAYFVLSMILTHSFLAYFVGSDRVIGMIQHSPFENPEPFLVIVVTTALVLFDFGWFREQFCTIICPYGRFQSVLMDTHSLAVLYDEKRGEPRRGQVPDGQTQGDCVSCFRCVQVCPTGIDIRRGVQMECIACTACIDACDQVMTKLKKPKGLIRYASERSLEGKPTSPWRVRNFLYFGSILICIFGLVFALATREALELRIIRAIETPYQVVKNESGQEEVINHFKLAISNQSSEEISFTLEAPKEWSFLKANLVSAQKDIKMKSGENRRLDVFVRYPKKSLTLGRGQLPFAIYGQTISGEPVKREGTFGLVGPY